MICCYYIDEQESLKAFESIDCVNADLNHTTKVCMHCLTTYKDDRIFCRKCLGELENIDTPILDMIFLLNKKGYKTEFCCSGHPESAFYFSYILISGIIDGIIAPEGFTIERKNNKTTIASINPNKGKKKLTTAEMEEVAKKCTLIFIYRYCYIIDYVVYFNYKLSYSL